ncbi:hypothetical protein [Halorubrum vacuolatum]|uniref:Uncharacterized protein n=1 Tax=Halorubrum vacuolatum TaxID=63740 RepID=A0A238XCL6_HALVU|nr:hypothetical protein [Halorubrum vacuolatum]SNR56737.1 hypothetical protein SAMN06264855_11618 [Halorubrum vacuolatum]
MTDSVNDNGTINVETASEDDHSRTSRSDEQWEQGEKSQDQPDRGAKYYNRLIDLDTWSYTYIRYESTLEFRWQGELRDTNEFKDALYELYRSTYLSDLSPADLRPKAFRTFVSKTISNQLANTLQQRKLIEGSPGSHKQEHEQLYERIAGQLYKSVVLACEHRAEHGRRPQSRDEFLQEVLPASVHESSA